MCTAKILRKTELSIFLSVEDIRHWGAHVNEWVGIAEKTLPPDFMGQDVLPLEFAGSGIHVLVY